VIKYNGSRKEPCISQNLTCLGINLSLDSLPASPCLQFGTKFIKEMLYLFTEHGLLHFLLSKLETIKPSFNHIAASENR
jgi:hypothetical protein